MRWRVLPHRQMRACTSDEARHRSEPVFRTGVNRNRLTFSKMRRSAAHGYLDPRLEYRNIGIHQLCRLLTSMFPLSFEGWHLTDDIPNEQLR